MFFYFFDGDGPEGHMTEYSEATFEDIKHIDEEGREFWYARELQKVLEYTEWRNFSKVIDKAKEACQKAGNVENDYFVDLNKTVETGIGQLKNVSDLKLSRYACYLIVQNGDPTKDVIALGQTYFAVKTRQQELIEQYDLRISSVDYRVDSSKAKDTVVQQTPEAGQTIRRGEGVKLWLSRP